MEGSKLLINEPPLEVLPTLAIKIGLEEAIIVQQIHYWLLRSTHIKNDRKWIYNTYDEWRKQFPWWSIKTIKRYLEKLEISGVVLAVDYKHHYHDTTKWYSLDYIKIDGIGDEDGRFIREHSKLLINEPPLEVLPTLAIKIRLGEAIIVQQIHYWLLRSTHIKNDRKWIYNTYDEWRKQFPWWSIKTIERKMKKLEVDGIVLIADYNHYRYDKTKWYSLDYAKIESLSDDDKLSGLKTSCPDEGQVVQIEDRLSGSKTDCPDQRQTVQIMDNLSSPIPETTTETTDRDYSETTSDNKKNKSKNEEIISELQELFKTYTTNPDLITALNDWLEVRITIPKKGKPTVKQVGLVLEKLDILSQGHDLYKIAVLRKSTIGEYADVFPLSDAEYAVYVAEHVSIGSQSDSNKEHYDPADYYDWIEKAKEGLKE